MRSHGVSAFPDPQIENGALQLKVNPGQIDPNSPIVKAAANACRGKLSASDASNLFSKLTGR
jgi:hypothetical protein